MHPNAFAQQLLHPLLHAQHSEATGRTSLTHAQKTDPRLRWLCDVGLEKLVQRVLARYGHPKYELRDGLQEVRLRALEWFVYREPPAAGLFREGRMPEHGVDIPEGAASACTHGEIAQELGISDRTVEGRLKTMRKAFRQRIEERGMGYGEKSTEGARNRPKVVRAKSESYD
jgi:hypothetical protein